MTLGDTAWTKGLSDAEILYRYAVEQVLPRMSADGLWVAPAIAPLKAAEMKPELERIAQHPIHKRQTITLHSLDGKRLHLRPDKAIVVEDDPEADMRPHYHPDQPTMLGWK